ncbi:MAG: DbpA RNA binding domain-containing protein, partial [Prevotella sp.]|nr:DbpA RNA binding domain-containing protein [Prevotella sp.]
GKDDGFYPGEVMQFINRHVPGRQKVKVGQIDLLAKFCYIEVPEEDAERVMEGLDGATYHNREVRCNDADSRSQQGGGKGAPRDSARSPRRREERRAPADNFARFDKKSRRTARTADEQPRKNKRGTRGGARMESGRQDDWRQFFQGHDIILKDDEPDFSEEGWARRKPKKKS